jgi:hypothetical protein
MPVNNPTSLPATSIISDSGSYAGDSSANKAIAHTLGKVPKLVTIAGNTAGEVSQFFLVNNDTIGVLTKTTVASCVQLTKMTTTNFYVGSAGSYPNSANSNAVTYYWWAYG